VVIYEATNELSKDTRKLAVARGLYEPGAAKPVGWRGTRRSGSWSRKAPGEAAQLRAVSSQPRLQHVPESLPEGFGQRLTRLVKAAQAQGALVVLTTFSYRLRASRTGMSSSRRPNRLSTTALYELDALLEGYEAYNRTIREWPSRPERCWWKTSLPFPETKTFHRLRAFHRPRSAAQARRVTRRLLDSVQFRRSPERIGRP